MYFIHVFYSCILFHSRPIVYPESRVSGQQKQGPPAFCKNRLQTSWTVARLATDCCKPGWSDEPQKKREHQPLKSGRCWTQYDHGGKVLAFSSWAKRLQALDGARQEPFADLAHAWIRPTEGHTWRRLHFIHVQAQQGRPEAKEKEKGSCSPTHSALTKAYCVPPHRTK